MLFSDFALDPRIGKGIAAAGYCSPTPIQAQAIPHVMLGRDLMGLAQTGTGKTAAFALPILHRLCAGPRGRARALVLAPTRELAEQIRQSFDVLGSGSGLRCAAVYGGVGINPQVHALRRADIVVACPGRLLDHLNRGTANLSGVEVLVLDEADHMFDMGFLPDVRRILKAVPEKRQTLLFSATMPEAIRTLAEETLDDPLTVRAGEIRPVETVAHALCSLRQTDKTPALKAFLRGTDTNSVLVFTRTKHRAKTLARHLVEAGVPSDCLQGNMSQNRRQAAMDAFRNGKIKVLVATDIAARGIDVNLVSHVVNFDMPDTVEAYTHRIGRTGRAERAGFALTLVTGEDEGLVRAVERVLGRRIERTRIPGFTPAQAQAAAAPQPASDFDRPDRRFSGRPGKAPAGRSGGRDTRGSGYGRGGSGSRDARGNGDASQGYGGDGARGGRDSRDGRDARYSESRGPGRGRGGNGPRDGRDRDGRRSDERRRDVRAA
ncbi:MAG: DEAD/DEAH box helicase [Thermodesulfobacteriota bacterium]